MTRVRKIAKQVINRKIGQANSHTSDRGHPQMSWVERAFLQAKRGSMIPLSLDQFQQNPTPKKGANLQIPGSSMSPTPQR